MNARDGFVGTGHDKSRLPVGEVPEGDITRACALSHALGRACGITACERLADALGETTWMIDRGVRQHIVEHLRAQRLGNVAELLLDDAQMAVAPAAGEGFIDSGAQVLEEQSCCADAPARRAW